MLSHRLQLLLDERQFQELETEAKRCHVSVASIIREAISRRLEDDISRRRAAIEHILATGPVPVPDDPGVLKKEFYDELGSKYS
ncbi:MAG: antitoxin [Chloroflexi bacterium]|nr:antitoxin [Chloroflexota bacterium]